MIFKNDIGKWSKISPEMGQNWSIKVERKNIQYIKLNYFDLQQFYEIFMEKLRYLEYNIKLLV